MRDHETDAAQASITLDVVDHGLVLEYGETERAQREGRRREGTGLV